jgi:dolichol-phosphate mannosyltransferase
LNPVVWKPRIEDLRPSRLPAAVVAAAVGAGSAVLLILRLFVPRPVGMADNYDGVRLMCHLGVDVRLPRGTPRLRDYVYYRYDHRAEFSCHRHALGSIRLPDVPYRSSQVLVLYAGRALTRLLGLPGYLDLRAVGIVCCLLIGAAVALLYRVATLRHRYRLLLCGAVVAVVADTVFIDYAVSPFSEIASVIGLLFVAAGVLLLAGPSRRRRLAGIAVTGVSGLFLATAKTQNVPLLLPLAVVLLVPAVPIPARLRAARLTGLTGLTGLDRRLRHRLTGLVTVAVLAVGAVTVAGNQDKRTTQLGTADFVNVTLLPTSAHPERDLAELGGPAWLADYSGSPAWCAPLTLQNGAAYRTYNQHLSHKRILSFLLNHPTRLLPILDKAASYFYKPRPTATLCTPGPNGRNVMVLAWLGNYTHLAHTPPGRLDDRWAPVTGALGLLRGGGVGILLLLWLLPLAAVVATRRRRALRGVGMLLGLSVAVAVTQYGASALADGIDTAKHLDLAVFATALAWVFAAGELLAAFTARGRRGAGAGGEIPQTAPAQASEPAL